MTSTGQNINGLVGEKEKGQGAQGGGGGMTTQAFQVCSLTQVAHGVWKPKDSGPDHCRDVVVCSSHPAGVTGRCSPQVIR
jgi:hypothetical protein